LNQQSERATVEKHQSRVFATRFSVETALRARLSALASYAAAVSPSSLALYDVCGIEPNASRAASSSAAKNGR